MTRVLLILSICLAFHGHQTDGVLSALFTVMSTLKDIYEYASSVKSTVVGYHPILGGRFEDPTAIAIRQVNSAMKSISRQLYSVEENLINEIDQLRVTLLHRLPLSVEYRDRLEQFSRSINKVNAVYEDFVFYQNTSHLYRNTTITGFMTDLVRDSSELNSDIASIFNQFLSTGPIISNVLSVIVAVESQGEQRCGNKSAQQKLFEIYQTIILTEMQGYAMNVYAFGVLKQVDNGSYTGELDKLETQFKRRCEQYLRSVKAAMLRLSTEIHLCEPANHVRGETFSQFTQIPDYYDSHAPHVGIDFRPQIADVGKNMVVTGVRMVLENETLHLQIEQGKLKSLGVIETVDQPWKPIQPYPTDTRYSGGNLTDRERGFNLDDIMVPDNFVVTGVKFEYDMTRRWEQDWRPFVLRVHATKYNSDTGNLEVSNNMWISATSTIPQMNRTELNVFARIDAPIETIRDPVLILSRPGQFIRINPVYPSDGPLVPYVDIQPVSMEPRLALSGIGLYHRGKAGFGGLLGLRLFGLNIAPHMKSDLS